MFGPTRGHTVANSYVFVEGDRALLVDTSYSVHEEGLLAALEEVLPPGAELELFPPRLGEFDSVCNVVPVVERFGVQAPALRPVQRHALGRLPARASRPDAGARGRRELAVRLRPRGKADRLSVPP